MATSPTHTARPRQPRHHERDEVDEQELTSGEAPPVDDEAVRTSDDVAEEEVRAPPRPAERIDE